MWEGVAKIHRGCFLSPPSILVLPLSGPLMSTTGLGFSLCTTTLDHSFILSFLSSLNMAFFCYTQIKKFHVDYPISDKGFLFQATFLHVQIAGSSQRAGSSPTVLWLQHSTEFQLGCAAPNTCFCPGKMLLPPPRPLPDSQLRTGHSMPMTYFLEIYSLSSPSPQYTSSNH